MAQSDAGAIDVGDFSVEIQLLFAAEILSSKSFIQLDLFKIVDFKAGFFPDHVRRVRDSIP